MKNGNLYKLLFDHMLNGFAHCAIIYDDNGRAIDWRYIAVNPAFEKQTRLMDVVGKLASEVIPGIHTSDPEILEIYAHCAETLLPQRFERYLQALQGWYEVTVFSHEKGTFTAVFDVVTYRKQMEITLYQERSALEQAYDETMVGWARALELRNQETKGHSERVVEMLDRLARVMGIEEAKLIHYRRGALLHDIGKMGIPDTILLKPGDLTEDERGTMSLHPELAYMLMKPIHFLEPALDIPYCHHERWDGSGYPRGLKGKQIPLSARLFSVVDVYDAMLSNRVYREGMEKKYVLEYIKSMSGAYFDPEVVTNFLGMFKNGEEK
jgi:HD-GYP domain-containing protein (c-di-GMP phosphodiesterase class II)